MVVPTAITGRPSARAAATAAAVAAGIANRSGCSSPIASSSASSGSAMGAKVPIVMASAVLKKAGVPKDGFQDLDDSLSGAPILPPSGAGGEPIECAKARLLKRLGRSEWAQAAAICVSKGGKP